MGYQEYTTPGTDTHTVKNAVKVIKIYLTGGGGGGGLDDGEGDGGGGGAYLDKSGITTTPGSVFDLSVGAGGSPESGGTESTWETSEYIAGGGTGGQSGTLGVGGTVSGSGTPSNSASGGTGGGADPCCGLVCDDCVEVEPDVFDCMDSHEECANYGAGGGGAGSISGNGGGGQYTSCGGGGTPCGEEDFPGNSGSGAGGGNAGFPGGGGNTNSSGADGYVKVEWTNGNLTFNVQPSNVRKDAVISPSIQVTARYSDNATATTYTGNITLTIDTGTGTLGGTTTQAAVAGIATFNDITLNTAQTGVVLLANAASDTASIDPQTSATFNVYILTDGLESCWEGNEASGNRTDSHGSNHLTEQTGDNGSVGTTTGKINGARDYETGGGGNGNHHNISSNASLSLANGSVSYTLTGWVKFENLSGVNFTLAAKCTAPGATEYGIWYSGASGYWAASIGNGSTGANSTVSGYASEGVWYFISARYNADANTITCGVGSTFASPTSFSDGGASLGGDFAIAKFGSFTNYYMDGAIDQVCFWKRYLLDDEVLAIYNSGDGLAYPFTGTVITPGLKPRFNNLVPRFNNLTAKLA